MAVHRLEDKLSEQFGAYAEQQQYSGTILVAQEGNVRFAKAYGLANGEHEVPNRLDTKFQIASITKPITAMAVLMLSEKGLLDIQGRLLEYLPECEGLGLDSRITIHQLLTHTSGIRDFEKLSAFVNGEEKTLYEGINIMNLIRHDPQEFEPGTKWAYCNTGYNLLGAMIGAVSGSTYSDFVQQHILTPLGMDSTGFGCSRTVVPGRADGYSLNEQGSKVKARFFELGNFSASGHLYSTADDLLKWDRALYPGRLVSEELLWRMFTPHAFVDATRGYGYGWSVYSESRGHGGWLPGYWCKFRQYPEQQLVVIMLSNQDYTKEERILDRTEALFKEYL